MWVCTNFGFFSAVHRKTKDIMPGDNRVIVIRARNEEQLVQLRERYFLDELSDIVKLLGRDYQVRAYCTPEALGRALAAISMDIDYTNFKDSVKDHDLHVAYMKVWSAMADAYGTGYHTGMPWWETYRAQGAAGTKPTGTTSTTPGKRGSRRGSNGRFVSESGWSSGPDAYSQPEIGAATVDLLDIDADLDELEVDESTSPNKSYLSLTKAARLVGTATQKLRDFMLSQPEWKDYRDGHAWFIPADMIEDLEFKFWAEAS